MAVSMSKIREQGGEGMVSLVKNAGVSLDKHAHMVGHTAKVALILDYSGSMEERYRNGEVQELSERALALGLKFDDDGDIDVFAFDSRADNLGVLSLDNFQGGVARLTHGRRMGMTDYAAAVECVLDFYGFHGGAGAPTKKKLFHHAGPARTEPTGLPAEYPVYAMFITDGEPNDYGAAETAIRRAADFPVFWQFMGLGRQFDFLEKLDDMPGRTVDNANFFSCESHRHEDDQWLFDHLLEEYPGWVPQVQQLGMLK